MAIQQMNKQYGSEIGKKGLEKSSMSRQVPFSSPQANYMTYGGIPLGKVTEFFGQEGGGKTTSALDIVANAQKMFYNDWDDELYNLRTEIEELEKSESKSNAKKALKLRTKLEEVENKGPKVCVYMDLENTLDLQWATKLGVDVDEMYLVTPENQSAEQVLDMACNLIDTGDVGFLVLDSVPHLVPGQLLDESLEKKSYGGVAAVMASFSRVVTPKIHKHNVGLLIINQVREKLNSMYGGVDTPGGRALKHLYSVRIRFRKGSFINEVNKEISSNSENPHGNLVQMEITKSKSFPSTRRLGYYTLKYLEGIDIIGDTIQMAVNNGFIETTGSWYRLVDPETGELLVSDDGLDTELKFQGKSKLIEYFRENEELFEELLERINLTITAK